MRKAAARIGLLTGATLLAGCTPAPAPVDGLPSAPPRPGAEPPAHPAACSPEGIRITGLGVSAAMGLRAMGLDLVNCGDRPYELRGYPAVALRDADGDAIAVRIIPGAAPITSGFDDPPTRIVLAPGERAGAALIWRNLVTDRQWWPPRARSSTSPRRPAGRRTRSRWTGRSTSGTPVGSASAPGSAATAPRRRRRPRASDPPAPSTSPVNPL